MWNFTLPPAALMEAGTVVPNVSRPGRDGEPHVPVHQPGGCTRRAGGRDSPAVRRAAVPADAQAGNAQLWPGGPPAGLEDRRAHRQGWGFFHSHWTHLQSLDKLITLLFVNQIDKTDE